ncbi:MAG: hypothetical protein FWF90_00105 [Promicromonosporaceae bacterium]|nr:hypothetical protein [Promicromonosporaceae bacterium]
MRSDLRVTDLLARAGVFAGAPPASVDRAPGVEPVETASALWPAGPGFPAPVTVPSLHGAGPPARQIDETTCGAAVLAMLALAGDPDLARRVAADPGPRFAVLQRRLHRECAREGWWPRRLGTAPWAAARVARCGPVRYTHRVVGSGAEGEAVLHAAVAAASSGVPVPLFTGGDLARGWQTAVPRHVVLLVDAAPGPDGVARVYEPSSAALHAVPVQTLLQGAPERDLMPALGWWPHVVWAVLPRTPSGR